MRNITILYRKEVFALTVDNIYQPVQDENDLLTKLIELNITKAHAEDAITRLKNTKAPVQLNS